MSDAIIGAVLTQLGSILEKQIRQELRLVVGVDKDVYNLERTFKSIRTVLLDAEMSRVKKEKEKEGIEIWLQDLQDVSYDMDDILAVWSNAILKINIEGAENTSPKKKVCFFINSPCFCFGRVALRRDIALRIKELNERLDQIAREKDRYNLRPIESVEPPKNQKTTSHIDLSEDCGRDEEHRDLVRELLVENGNKSDRGLHLISIVGMGGIGKSFLAQLAYQCNKVKDHFKEKIWVCVSEPFDASRIAKAIIEGVEGNAPNLVEPDPIMSKLRKCIDGKKFLLVLDDVWTEDPNKWESLRPHLNNGVPGSKILVTTRNERVSKMMGSIYTLRLGVLSVPYCWSLFSQIAFFDKKVEERRQLEVVGMEIARKCKGLPLAAKTVGSVMRFKNSLPEWQSVLDSFMWGVEETKEKEGPFPPLLLSYYYLTSTWRRCFSYCAIFPKDYKIEADNLIKMWMAQGYIETEETGRECLNNLISRCFFQDLEKDKDNELIVRFKMHDMVHDFAQYLTQNECHMMEVESHLGCRISSSSSKARHLTLVRAEDVPFPLSITNIEKPLHTFWVQTFYDCPALVSEEDKVSPEIFSHLSNVKALDLSRNRLLELPKEIGELMNLRFLNLSHNPLNELPELICGLYNLQTLKLVACKYLRRLPQGIGKLINLRHLEMDGTDKLEAFPEGIGKLRSLQTLNKFIIAGNRNLEERLCKLGDLKELNLLKGRLRIGGLGLVSNVEEATKAELKNKTYLTDIHMDFKVQSRAEGRLDVFEALELNPQLQSLQISFYGDTKLPSWITFLTNLRKLQLQDCQNCTELPPLGRLSSLQTLNIENMHKLKHIGSEFLGTNGTTSVASSSIAPTDIFPKLKKLKFENMTSLEEWEFIISTIKSGADEVNFRIMPCLRYLKLSDCGKLKELPDHLLEKTPIRKLRISKCPLLQQQYHKRTGDQWIKISHIQKVRIA